MTKDKTFFDYPDEEKKEIIEQSAREATEMQEKIVDTVNKTEIIKKFYELKEKGLCPRVLVHQLEDEDNIGYARLQLPGVDLYFHNTNGEKVEKIESVSMSGKKMIIWSIPFDGWETNDFGSDINKSKE